MKKFYIIKMRYEEENNFELIFIGIFPEEYKELGIEKAKENFNIHKERYPSLIFEQCLRVDEYVKNP